PRRGAAPVVGLHAEELAQVCDHLLAGLLQHLARGIACSRGPEEPRPYAHVCTRGPFDEPYRGDRADAREPGKRRGEADLLALTGGPRVGAHANSARCARPPMMPSTAPCASNSHSSSLIAERIISEKS